LSRAARANQRFRALNDVLAGVTQQFGFALRAAVRDAGVGADVVFESATTERAVVGGGFVGARIRPDGNADKAERQKRPNTCPPEIGKRRHVK
jgi:hypothetical protein